MGSLELALIWKGIHCLFTSIVIHASTFFLMDRKAQTHYILWLLNEQDLDLPDIIVESEKRGISFDNLLTIPEKDDWVYSDGKSTSCVVFILEMYKEAGLFDPITSSIQATEFTVSTLHVFKIFSIKHTSLFYCQSRTIS
jgi:hypothetical protein